MKEPSSFGNVNLEDPRQDVHRVRKEQPGLNRYRVAERLLPANPAGLKILEIGGGAAEFSRRMQELGVLVTFVDLSPANVKRASSLLMHTTIYHAPLARNRGRSFTAYR